MTPLFYRTSFSKHLWNLAASGYFARGLDADDHEFLEKVRVRGIANGELPNTTAVLIEELDFWHLPYAVEHGIARKAGPVPLRTPETPEQRALREAKSRAWHARRALAKTNKEIAEAELERERREHAEANARRKMREKISDREWEAAAPKRKRWVPSSRARVGYPWRGRRQFGKVVDRHYVPQWKVDDDTKRAKVAAARLRAIERQKNDERKAARERMAQKAQEAIRQAEQAVKTLEQVRRDLWYTPMDVGNYKQTILTLLRNSGPYVWTVETVMRSTGCHDEAFVRKCLTEMMRDGQLRKVPVPEGQT